MLEHGGGKRGVKNLLCLRRAPLKIPAGIGIVERKMIGKIAERRLARRVEPRLHSIEVALAGGMRQVVRYRPNARQYREEVHLRVTKANSIACERGGGRCRGSAGSRSKSAVMNTPRSFAVAYPTSPT